MVYALRFFKRKLMLRAKIYRVPYIISLLRVTLVLEAAIQDCFGKNLTNNMIDSLKITCEDKTLKENNTKVDLV